MLRIFLLYIHTHTYTYIHIHTQVISRVLCQHMCCVLRSFLAWLRVCVVSGPLRLPAHVILRWKSSDVVRRATCCRIVSCACSGIPGATPGRLFFLNLHTRLILYCKISCTLTKRATSSSSSSSSSWSSSSSSSSSSFLLDIIIYHLFILHNHHHSHKPQHHPAPFHPEHHHSQHHRPQCCHHHHFLLHWRTGYLRRSVRSSPFLAPSGSIHVMTRYALRIPCPGPWARGPVDPWARPVGPSPRRSP